MMQNDSRKILTFYGLKFHPFRSEVPPSAIFHSKKISMHLWSLENLVMDGGIAAIIGDPGFGKSCFLRLLAKHLQDIPDVRVVHIDRPHSSLADFYRELGDIFELELKVNNRWGGFKTLRQKWLRHIETTLLRPVLIVDEAQLMNSYTLTELRLLGSDEFDSRRILTLILAGDKRLSDRLQCRELLPLDSRIRPRIEFGIVPPEELISMLTHLLQAAGNPGLVSDGLVTLLSEHCCGCPRTMLQTADDLLVAAAQQERNQLDEGLYYEVFQEKLGKPRPSRRKS